MASLALRSARPWRAMGMRDRPAGCASCATRLCGALWGSGRPPRGGRRRSFVGGESGDAGGAENRRRAPACVTSVARPAAPAGGASLVLVFHRALPDLATAQQRATNTTLAVTRRHQRRAIAQQRTTNTTLAATRRHQRRATAQQRATNTTLAATRRHRCMLMLLLRPPAAPRGSATGCSPKHGAERSAVKGAAFTLYGARVFARARARGAALMAAARRELGGGVRQHPGSTTALRGLMASLALPGASPWRAMSMRDRPAGCASCATRLCGALWGSGRPPRGGRRRSFVGGERWRGRCWRRRDVTPRSPLINKPRDLRFGAQFKPSARAALPRPFLRPA